MVDKIWHLNSNRWNSAITEYSLSCARAWELRGYRSIYSALAGGHAEKRAQQLGLSTESFTKFSLQSVFKFLRLAKKLKPTLIICYGGEEAFLYKISSAFLGNVPMVRFRGDNMPYSSWRKFLCRVEILKKSLLLFPSHTCKNYVRNLSKNIDASMFLTVPLGIDTDLFFYQKSTALEEKRPEVLIFGRLDPVKGHVFFLSIFKRCLDIWPEDLSRPVLRIIGEEKNTSEKEIKENAEKHHLLYEKDISIEPHRVSDVAKCLSSAAVGVVSSLGSEVICRVAQEFLLCGVPIFVSGAGSLNECLFPGAGLSYQGKTIEEAAFLLRDLLLSVKRGGEEERRQRAQKASEVFSLKKMADNLCEEFQPFFCSGSK